MAEVPIRIVLRPYASSIPLASFAFATGNVLYSAYLLHWIPASEMTGLALVLLCFVAPLELVPSAMAFLARDTGGATAFAIFGASWVAVGLQLLLHLPGRSRTAGMLDVCLAVCLVMLAIVTFPGKPLLGVVLAVAVVRTSLGGSLALVGGQGLGKATGVTGLVLAALAFYCALAFLEEDVTSEISPLTFRTGAAKAAMEGKLEDQIEAITREAGVRKQL